MKTQRDQLIGLRFGRLVVLDDSGKRTSNGAVIWDCKCDCGNVTNAKGYDLKSGHKSSCGCLRGGLTKEWRRLYRIYKHMKERCVNENDAHYKNYGGRGIGICDEWADKHGFLYFKDWALANGYRDDLTLDRIDCNGDYCPENCRFVDMKTQQNNRTNNFRITIDGETKTLAQWCEQYNAPYKRTLQRIRRDGWSAKDALSIPRKGEQIYA